MELSNPIWINKYSSPTTLSKFIHDRLFYMVDYFYLDDAIIQINKKRTSCCIIIILFILFY
jgi:hypothetical protein